MGVTWGNVAILHHVTVTKRLFVSKSSEDFVCNRASCYEAVTKAWPASKASLEQFPVYLAKKRLCKNVSCNEAVAKRWRLTKVLTWNVLLKHVAQQSLQESVSRNENVTRRYLGKFRKNHATKLSRKDGLYVERWLEHFDKRAHAKLSRKDGLCELSRKDGLCEEKSLEQFLDKVPCSDTVSEKGFVYESLAWTVCQEGLCEEQMPEQCSEKYPAQRNCHEKMICVQSLVCFA